MSDMFPYRHPDWYNSDDDDFDDDIRPIRFWDIDDEGNVVDIEPPPDLGSCCVCGKHDMTVHNIMMLNRRAPTPGYGWGCVVCGLPSDGAVAVLCDACLESNAKVFYACDGYPADGKRVPVIGLSDEPFDHDLSKHPELREPSP